MKWEGFVTCAVTGVGDTVARSEHVPVTPQQIADAAIEAAEAGAAIAHIHVRDPETGRGSRDTALYRAVVERIRASEVDIVLNLTAGMGGDLVVGSDEEPLPLDDDGTDLAGATERLAHVEELLPAGTTCSSTRRVCCARWHAGFRSSASAPSSKCSIRDTSCS